MSKQPKAPKKAANKVAKKAPAKAAKKVATPAIDASLPTGLLAQDRLAVKRDYAAQIKACKDPAQRTALRRELQRTIKGK